MLVKAKWNVKDSSGWHMAGEVFSTDADLGDAVEVIEAKVKKVEKPEPVEKTEVPEMKQEEPKEERPKSVSRRKSITK